MRLSGRRELSAGDLIWAEQNAIRGLSADLKIVGRSVPGEEDAIGEAAARATGRGSAVRGEQNLELLVGPRSKRKTAGKR